MQPEKNNLTKIDMNLVFILVMMFIVSCIALYSAQTTAQYSENFLLKQFVWYTVGIGVILSVVTLDSDQLKKITWYAYGFGIFLLVLLIIAPDSLAPVRNGAKSWFIIKPIGSVQPSEFMKVFLILALANVTSVHHQNNPVKTNKTDFLLLGKIIIITMLPAILVMQQPDLGTTMVLLAIMVGIIFISGISWRILTPLITGALAFISTVLYFVIWNPAFLENYLGVKEYQFGRIYSWLDPYNYQGTSGYHLTRSLLAIGSGETMGKGVGSREVYLPESHSDFIFSVIGEEFGFIGSSLVISLFFLLIYHLTKVGLDTGNTYYTYICVGVISMITFHVFQNIGMTIGLLPITGIPLPFISYGGSSLLGNMLAIGLIFSIHYHKKKYMFSTDN